MQEDLLEYWVHRTEQNKGKEEEEERVRGER